MGWKLLPTQSKDLGSPINAATECFADTDQDLLRYRLGITFNAGRSEIAKPVYWLVVRAFGGALPIGDMVAYASRCLDQTLKPNEGLPMRVATLLGLMLVLSISTGASAVEDNVMKQLVPTGKLRVGVAYAPAPTPIFVAKDAAGDVHGVPRDLARSLRRLAYPSRSSL
jgi:hypothetical protein